MMVKSAEDPEQKQEQKAEQNCTVLLHCIVQIPRDTK